MTLLPARVVITLAMAAALAGCAATAESRFGQAYYDVFAAQVLNPKAADSAKPQLGLDSPEAALVVQTYHKSLAPTAVAADASDEILYIAPQKNAPLKPSVPNAR